jgi:hypothetical protein
VQLPSLSDSSVDTFYVAIDSNSVAIKKLVVPDAQANIESRI